MDKETLSHYGLILVSIMIVSVLIVFATPFGDYMGNVINNIGQSLTQTQDKANYDNAESEMEDLFQKDKNSSGIGISN